MLNGESHWKIEQYFYWPCLTLMILIAVGGLLAWLLYFGNDDYDFDRGERIGVASVWSVVWTIVMGLMLLGQYPFSGDFHKWYGVEGTVSATSSRLLTDGDGNVSQKVVVRFNESQTLYGCTDTRCAIAHTGDHLKLLCARSFDFNAVPGWDCKYDQAG